LFVLGRWALKAKGCKEGEKNKILCLAHRVWCSLIGVFHALVFKLIALANEIQLFIATEVPLYLLP